MTNLVSDLIAELGNLHSNEQLKFSSKFLRGNIPEGLANKSTGSMPAEDPLLLKFHGIYQQDDRDIRTQRQERLLEPNYQFMVRLRIPGGLLTKSQWNGLDAISRKYADRGIRITTRQTIQFHGVRKRALKSCMKAIQGLGLDTIAACGDDSRGVVCGANPYLSDISKQIQQIARRTSERLIPRTSAYKEIWYEESPKLRSANEEPIYGPLYLPRKFKVGFAIPPSNDIDVYGQDVGFIAVIRDNKLIGFNLCVGGGMGKVDNRQDSYPRLAQEIGFIKAQEAPEVAEIIMGIQRDFGDRKDRHQARFKYTLDRKGMPWFLELLKERRGKSLLTPYPIQFTHNGDEIGWKQGDNGRWHCTLHINSGRITGALRDQLAGFCQQYSGEIRITTNQNLQLTNVPGYELDQVKIRLDDIGLEPFTRPGLQAAISLSCVALPTCGLAMAEAERYLPDFLTKFNKLKSQHALDSLPITLRITGCPNGCSRPYIAEIALTGRAHGLYNLYLGGSHLGDRLASLYASNVNEEKIFLLLDALMQKYKETAMSHERFGDFLNRMDLLAAPNRLKA